ncbi:MAG: hypothetical protein AAB833_02170 [Patescibacteria group bacterium]
MKAIARVNNWNQERFDAFAPVILFTLIIFTLLLGFFYTNQLATVTENGYLALALRNSNQSLNLESERLQTDIHRLRSVASLKKREIFLPLVHLPTPILIHASNAEAAVALR